MTTDITTYEGRWRKLVNTSAERKGSIHDDDAARTLGFRGGFVPGSVVGTAALPAAVHAFGGSFLEGGWYAFNFVSPVYTTDTVREVAEPVPDGLAIQVVTDDGRLCCNGRAGLGLPAPWESLPTGAHGAESVLPGIDIGHDLGEMAFTPDRANIERMLTSGGDTTPWYVGSSPWGSPVVPPEHLHAVALQLVRTTERRPARATGVREPGMWAEHTLAITEPLFLDKSYRMREWVADKGRSGRAVFLTYAFEVFDGDRSIARGQHKVKWLATPDADGPQPS